MPIYADFSNLWRAVNKIAESPAEFDLVPTTTFDPIDMQLEEGLEIVIEDVDFSGPVASYQGRQILLYIPDHGHKVEEVLSGHHDGKKFHVTDCKTLDAMRNQNRFERYFATNDLSGEFKIHGQTGWGGKHVEGKARLRVCKNCMNRLNYKGYKTDVSFRAKDEFVSNFDIAKFFETYSSFFRTMPRAFRITDNGSYTNDWSTIAANLKKEQDYTCNECRVNLTQAKILLHVHHINGVKSDNTRSNLRVLCADCHRRQPMHGHIHISHQDMQLINRLRRAQHKISDSWEEALQLAEPAIFGALCHHRRVGYPAPEIGFELQNDRQEVVAEFEAAWPLKRYALVLFDSQIPSPIPSGWNIVTLADYHEDHL